MESSERYLKLVSRLKLLSTRLYQEKSLTVHQNIDHFYYLQKIEQMKFLLVRLEDLELQQVNLKGIIDSEYRLIFGQWKKDVRYLQRYIQTKTGNISTL